MRIAIIGTGIAGLACAWSLREKYELSVFEAADYAGGHANTVRVGDQPVDTGFIVYNERNYPRLRALLRMLDVATQPSDMSFGVSIGGGRLEWAGDNWRTLFAQPRNALSLRHWRMIAHILRFNRQLKELLARDNVPDVTIGEFLDTHGYGSPFRDRYLVPMAAAIWSAPTATMLAFPLASFARFFDNHGLLDIGNRPAWRTVTGGSGAYVERILARLGTRVQLNNAIQSVVRRADGVHLRDARGRWRVFDQVVLATHADQSLALLTDANAAERRILGAFRFQSNRAILHSDPALMPRRRAVWSSWNYLATHDGPSGRDISVSYWMNRLQRIGGNRQYFVSLNPLRRPDPGHVHYETTYTHPVFDRAAVSAQTDLVTIQGRDRLWFCGAWCGYGFHEDGLEAAERVVRGIGLQPRWAARERADAA